MEPLASKSAVDLLAQEVTLLPDIGPKRAGLLNKMGIFCLRDLLLHFPRAYEDRRHVTPIAALAAGQYATIQGEVLSARNVRLRRNLNFAQVRLTDGSGEIDATFFGRGFLATTVFRPGLTGFFSGQVESRKGLSLKNPAYEMLTGEAEDVLHSGRITPIYALTEKLGQRSLRRWIYTALEEYGSQLEESLPEVLRSRYGFPPLQEALYESHFPSRLDQAQRLRARFVYEELLALQLALLGERARRHSLEEGCGHRMNGPLLKALGRNLPFSLTGSQDRVIAEILRDMAAPRAMARLVQGDVGCGKTIVALHAMAAAADGGYQTAMMAPTEILAEQHYLQLTQLLQPLGIRIALLTGAMRGAKKIRAAIERGEVQVVVGTHALIQDQTTFPRLGLVVVDEQHRFGVLQRARLAEKGGQPDVLHMTATPIPRTLAITLYGGMDLSIIDEMPPGRRPVKTRQVPEEKIADLYAYLVKEAKAGRQSYIICPLIEASEYREDLTSVISHFEELSEGPLAAVRTELLHGRLDAAEKEAIMDRFKAGAIDVLFSTTVIEVGIDVSTATTMVIENAGQFGLTQLHQLRGRVGRGAAQSHCFLLGAPRTEDAKERMRILCECASGFEIAEADLQLRGPGEFYGMRQAGLSDFHVADLLRDHQWLEKAREDAREILASDPEGAQAEYSALYAAARRYGAPGA